MINILKNESKHRCAPIVLLSLIPALGLSAQSVPSTYQSIYSNLTTQIQSFDNTVKAGWNQSPYPTLFTPQLQSASSDQYTSLLSSNYMAAMVTPQLAELQALGATGVTVHIDFPILYQPFFATEPSQYQQFVNFYQQLAQQVHASGLKLVVETEAGEPLPGDNANAFQAYYGTLNWQQYMNGRAQNALNIAQLIAPDYLTLITEPDTEQNDSGQANAGTPSGSLQLLQTMLSTLQAGGVTNGGSNTQFGAGAGTWTANYTQYLANYASTSVDFVDMHIYPVNGNDLMEALSAADTIHAAGKYVTLSECWPWKVSNTELGTLSYVNIAARNPFSFWAPVDTAFLQAIIDFSQYKQVVFVSPFWTDYFFSYLNYNTYGSLAPAVILPDAIAAADTAVGVGGFTSTGLAWENMIIKAPDTTPPATPAAPVASAIGTTGLHVTWNSTPDNVGVSTYRLYRNGALDTVTSGLVSYESNLTPGATYTYTLQAADASGNVSGLSAPLIVTTINTTPPPPPTNLTVTGVTSGTISLSWTPSTDISGIGGYRVLMGTSPTSLSIVANVTGNTFTGNGAPNTTYYYEVEAFIPNGTTSGPGNEVSATTLPIN
jgi:chitodextrinase